MSKQLFLLSDGESVLEARMMTMDEAIEAQIDREEKEKLKDGTLNEGYIWYGPFDVKDPATMRIVHVNVQETSIH